MRPVLHDADLRGATLSWQRFVLTDGCRAFQRDLSIVLGVPEDEIRRFRHGQGATASSRARPAFEDVFEAWHGRSPRDEEWPVPRVRVNGHYEWLGNEVSLLLSMVGSFGVDDISEMLTTRLRNLTGDPAASRTVHSVQNQINKHGMTLGDVSGGVTVHDAGLQVGSESTVRSLIQTGALPTFRAGRRLVIPHAAWKRFLENRGTIPDDHVRLADLRAPLGVRSNKLSEFARLNLIPGALRIRADGVGMPNTRHGTWFVPRDLADRLVADRRAGLPMPWHGAALPDNLKSTWHKWQARKHSASCSRCGEIWGEYGAPATLEAFCRRYPLLGPDEKRHLTKIEYDGMTIARVADVAGLSRSSVERAIQDGYLAAVTVPGGKRVTREQFDAWRSGRGRRSRSEEWMTREDAMRVFAFSEKEMALWIAAMRISTSFTDRRTLVSKADCHDVRRETGYSFDEALACLCARGSALMREIKALHLDPEQPIPAEVIENIRATRRKTSVASYYSFGEAALALGVDVAWVEARRDDGTIVVRKSPAAGGDTVITGRMLARMRRVLDGIDTRKVVPLSRPGWSRLAAAAMLAGVSIGTIQNWNKDGRLVFEDRPMGRYYEDQSVKAVARKYWASARHVRRQPPGWLVAEGFAGKLHERLRPGAGWRGRV